MMLNFFYLEQTHDVRKMAPGMVFIKGALDQEAQIYLAQYAMQAGADPARGFWETKPDGTRILNSRPDRGRKIYDSIFNLQDAEKIAQLCKDLVAETMKVDEMMPDINPTHLLLLYYATDRGIGWHADDGANDGDNNHPVVSITIGNSCNFGYVLNSEKMFLKLESGDVIIWGGMWGEEEEGGREEGGGDNNHPVVSITIGNSCNFGYVLNAEKMFLKLESGDVIIWGGPLRMMKHNVQKVYMKTCPPFLPLNDVRLNFTYRDAPSIIGKEDQFKYYVSDAYKNQQPELAAKYKDKQEKRK